MPVPATWVLFAWAWVLPPGFPTPTVPADNPMSPAKVELGRRLFAEPALSGDGRISCATCHEPARAFTDGRHRPRGARGDILPRNAPSLLNVAWLPALGWLDEGTVSLESQMRKPLFATTPVEMGVAGREAEVMARLRVEGDYPAVFAAAFPGDAEPLSLDNAIKAIAAYERTLFSGRSPFDRYVYEDERDALSDSAKRGMALFYSKRAACAQCHGGPAFSGSLRAAGFEGVKAQYIATGVSPGRFKVPGLRNVALTAPYMHDGSLPALRDVVDFYDRGGGPASVLKPLRLKDREKGDLVAFLESLSDR
ncbi:MAG: hypothetical protein RLZZ200_1134 [Pseudomonadota bacterium]|jgi:cytochrome c peroxidase